MLTLFAHGVVFLTANPQLLQFYTSIAIFFIQGLSIIFAVAFYWGFPNLSTKTRGMLGGLSTGSSIMTFFVIPFMPQIVQFVQAGA